MILFEGEAQPPFQPTPSGSRSEESLLEVSAGSALQQFAPRPQNRLWRFPETPLGFAGEGNGDDP
jgi:hypothetical protein